MRIVRSILLFSALAAPVISSQAVVAADGTHGPADGAGTNSAFVQKVKLATEGFRDVRNAASGGYGPVLGCVSGPQEGRWGCIT